MPRALLGATLALVLSGCYSPSFDHPACPTGDCPDGLVCDLDTHRCVATVPVDGASVDAPSSPIDASDSLIDAPTDPTIDACADTCDSQTGVISSCGAVVATCPAGCTSVDSPSGTGVHCKQLVASNGIAVSDLDGADDDLVLLPGMVYTFDTASGEIRRFASPPSGVGTVVRTAGVGLDVVSHIRFRTTAGAGSAPGLGIFGVHGLTVPATTIVRPIAPSGGRAIAIIAHDSIDIAGEIDLKGGQTQTAVAAASTVTPGPGGGRGSPDGTMVAGGCAAGGNGFSGMGSETGAGGGGLGTAGGKGGPQSGTSDMGGTAITMGMLVAACPQTNLVPLRGGSGGGGGGGGGGDGGGGGGAIQLTSLGAISVASGRLLAGGAGGGAGGLGNGGGGAGAGGAVLLEASSVVINGGFIVVGGGGGGAGNDVVAGQNGHDDGTAAGGGGNGGNGATGAGAGEVLAQDGFGNVDGTGGGGGGAGIIHLRSVAPVSIMGGAIIRPTASTSTATSQ